jgi:aminoglycoside phosphotransferase (APT) family kinase protein
VTAATNEVIDSLSRVLGGRVENVRRLSGGASRVTSSFDFVDDHGARRSLVIQQDRGDGATQNGSVSAEAGLLKAARNGGVPAPEVVASGEGEGLGPRWLVVAKVEGETIARKILRDPEWETARGRLTAQCGRALAAIHAIDPDSVPGLSPTDPLTGPLPVLDALGEVRPALELGARWLDAHRPDAGPRRVVHGDFRLGNLMVGPDGLRAVLDWELAHGGDPVEDIGWLCAPAWRFGGAGRVGGFGDLGDLLEAYEKAGGRRIDPTEVVWWEAHATMKWAVICGLQASAHLSGSTRSVELAAIGRRICESEWDLLALMGVEPEPDPSGATDSEPTRRPVDATPPFGRPTAVELVEAVSEYLEAGVMEKSSGRAAFDARVARNALRIAQREMRIGPGIVRDHASRLSELGVASDRELVAAIRAGRFDDDWGRAGALLMASARDQLRVANPSYLERPHP